MFIRVFQLSKHQSVDEKTLIQSALEYVLILRDSNLELAKKTLVEFYPLAKKLNIKPFIAQYEELIENVPASQLKNEANPAEMYKHPITITNYNQAIDIAFSEGINVVVMQYPTLNIQPLQSIFGSKTNKIIFIENKTNFDQLLANHKYDEVFYDKFGGSFGHFTPLGAEALATNVLNTLEKLVRN